eukprot:Seg367.2 transcript_id=Seg367.2/GoldUCD/mRNA.D3Y31 product="Pre-piRNA 3'-exonuclease trimmer" protein_id=Seg367.2/GoldUCD/D3Y31
MCDITRFNFEEKYAEIERAIKSSSFIALDAEYTCLTAHNNWTHSLSDTAEMRYAKLRKNVTQSTVSQIGISAFVPSIKKKNSYAVETFNVYLFPGSFGPVDTRFVCQASAVEFLCEHNFNFNKFLYEGVPYLNQDQEKYLREMHRLGRVKHSCCSMQMSDVDEDQRTLLDDIAAWRFKAKARDVKSFNAPGPGVSRYVLLTDLKERFKDLTCRYTANNKITITKTEDEAVVNNCFDEEFERLFQTQTGFSRMIQAISRSKKPIVGHNCLTDLGFIFDKFHKSLPESYNDFKRELHELFPRIYDTKNLSMLLRRKMRKETQLFNETKLSDLHGMLSSTQGTFYVLYSPFIEHAPGFDRYVDSEHIHEAGYDAYLTGYVFLRMAHFIAAKDIRSGELEPLPFREQLSAIKEFENHINIARAQLRYLNMGGDDPATRVPVRFVVTLKGNISEALSATELAHEFLPFGSVDVQLESSKKATVTISHSGRTKDVVPAFRRHRKYKVLPFNKSSYLKKENILKFGCGMALIIASGSIVYLLLSPSNT